MECHEVWDTLWRKLEKNLHYENPSLIPKEEWVGLRANAKGKMTQEIKENTKNY